MLHRQYPWAQGQGAWGGTYTRFRIVDSSRSMPVNFTANVGMEGEDHVLEVLEVLSRGVRDLLTERRGKGTLGRDSWWPGD